MNKSSLPQGVGRVIPPVPQVKVVQSVQPKLTPATNLRLSLSQLTTLRWSLTDEVNHLRLARYDGIGLWRPKVADLGVQQSAKLIRNAGLQVSSLSFAGGFTGMNGFSYADAIADARDAIVDAATLGARNLIVVSGTRNGHTVNHSRRCLRNALAELADFAATNKVRLCLLPMHQYFAKTWTYLNTLEEAVELIGYGGHPALGLAFDTYQLMSEERLIDWIPTVAEMTGIVQIADAKRPPRSRFDRWMPGEGGISLNEIIRSFHASGFDGYYDIQVCSATGLSDDYSETVSKCREAVLRLTEQTITI